MDPMEPIRIDELAAWSCDADAVLQALNVDPDHGLETKEVLKRRRIWGRNQLETTRPRHGLSILLAQFRSIVVGLLLVAGSLALLFSDFAEGLAIFAVILINAAIGFVTEWRAIRSMEALRQFVRVDCILLRNGMAGTVPAAELVPGDVVLIEAGDLVPADLRLIAHRRIRYWRTTSGAARRTPGGWVTLQ
jgi:Ca2+-transporting ATPase